MGAKKIKGARLLFDEPEVVLTLREKLMEWTEEHSKQLIGAVVAVLIVVVVVWGVKLYSDSKESRAQAEYAKVAAKFPQQSQEAKDWEPVVPDLEKFVKEYSGTASSRNAELELAQVYYRMQRYEPALTWATQAYNDFPTAEGLKSLAQYQMAMTYEAMGKNDEALGQWQALKNTRMSGLDREIDWHIGALYAKKQDWAKAADYYEQAVKAQGMYPASEIIQGELDAAKAKSGAPETPKQEKANG